MTGRGRSSANLIGGPNQSFLFVIKTFQFIQSVLVLKEGIVNKLALDIREGVWLLVHLSLLHLVDVWTSLHYRIILPRITRWSTLSLAATRQSEKISCDGQSALVDDHWGHNSLLECQFLSKMLLSVWILQTNHKSQMTRFCPFPLPFSSSAIQSLFFIFLCAGQLGYKLTVIQ